MQRQHMQTMVQGVPITTASRWCFKTLAIHFAWPYLDWITEGKNQVSHIKSTSIKKHERSDILNVSDMAVTRRHILTAASVDLYIWKKSEFCLYEQVVFSMWNSSKAIIHMTKKISFYSWDRFYIKSCLKAGKCLIIHHATGCI